MSTFLARKTFISLVFLILSMLPFLALGSEDTSLHNEYYTYYPALQNFNLINYDKCYGLVKDIMRSTSTYAESATKISQLFVANRSCDQASQLAKALDTQLINSIAVKKTAGFYIIDRIFFADGQHNYYILTPSGYLLNTLIDPRKLDSKLAARYQNANLFLANWDTPQYFRNKLQSFIITVRATDTCLACKTIGSARIKIDFDDNETLVSIKLLSFDNN